MEGLVVIDDPTSILRCCNKVYLHENFRRNRISAPKTVIVSTTCRRTLDDLEEQVGYPLVLKIPNGSFSRGVVRVENRSQLKETLRRMLMGSALILAQEYFYTAYDWRIGILNNRPLYASRYYMSEGHWQIYQHDALGTKAGSFTTMASYEVPRSVLNVALKAAKGIGDGLYGIDVKQDGNRTTRAERALMVEYGFALPSECEAIADLEKKVFLHDRLSPRQIRYHLKNDKARFCLAREGGIPVGYGLLLTNRRWARGRIYSLAVVQKWRGRGVGRGLLSLLEHYARQAELHGLSLEVRRDNGDAQALYAICGFALVGEKPGYYSDGESALLMRKDFI
ncbi:unnamed protein product [Cyprideis torosa]|uniref:Uncharacterized protein n=1 Tax=Cyprideis torosa TaxID=163714 RepID=A0A7R8WMA7_9CRUS|nr:unnamed protein product [Cyprideis torosa]CAG0899069.1 unnamed protein product [Cyprideis torosa]